MFSTKIPFNGQTLLTSYERMNKYKEKISIEDYYKKKNFHLQIIRKFRLPDNLKVTLPFPTEVPQERSDVHVAQCFRPQNPPHHTYP